jgi:hypothetical protein
MKRVIGLDRVRQHREPKGKGARRRVGLLCVTLVFALAACSGGGATSTGHRRVSPSASTDPATGPAAAAAVKAMWERFFNGTLPISSRLPLLQDGSAFATFVRSQAQTSTGSLILAATATVSTVTLQPPGQANVIFTILLGGKPLEKDLQGTAVYLAGHWKVAVTTFCSLLRLAYGKTSHVIPTACGS